MNTLTSDQTITGFAQHLNDGDGALAGFFALRPMLDGDIPLVLEAGDTALVVNDWKLSGTTPDGSAVHQSGRSADVLRHQSDGARLLLIDNPWG
jgi:hypothetical protein